MRKKYKYAEVSAPVGSLIITPKEIKAFKKHGIDLKKSLDKIQSEIYK